MAGRNFGCGSSREHAPWALEDHGFRVVIAPSFADIFRTNCHKIGLLPVELPEDEVRTLLDEAMGEPGIAAAVDLERQVVVAPGGREIPFAIDPVVRERLLNGWDDIALTLAHEEEISRYEATGSGRARSRRPSSPSGARRPLPGDLGKGWCTAAGSSTSGRGRRAGPLTSPPVAASSGEDRGA